MVKDSIFEVSLKDLLEAGCHFGHQAKRWNPKMAKYIWQAKEGVHIFDLVQTSQNLKTVCLKIRDFVVEGKVIVFIGTKRQAQAIVKEEAIRAEVPYVVTRWLGGMITNWEQIKKSIDKMTGMRQSKEKGEYQKYTKKENVLIDRDISRFGRFFDGLVSLKKPPDALFVVDVNREIAAVREARQKGVVIFAICDSNTDPDLVDWPIPANDDAVRSIKLIVGKVAQAVIEGKKLIKKK